MIWIVLLAAINSKIFFAKIDFVIFIFCISFPFHCRSNKTKWNQELKLHPCDHFTGKTQPCMIRLITYAENA